MFNRKMVLFEAKMMSKIDNFFDEILTVFVDRQTLGNIKEEIKITACHDRNFLSWTKDSDEGMCIRIHESYFTKRGFTVELDGEYVIVKW